MKQAGVPAVEEEVDVDGQVVTVLPEFVVAWMLKPAQNMAKFVQTINLVTGKKYI
jgi:hypothetical protein